MYMYIMCVVDRMEGRERGREAGRGREMEKGRERERK